MSGEIAVVVAGDLGAHPRMLNHAREIARRGAAVSFVGYRERKLGDLAGVVVCGLRGWRGLRRFGLPGAALRMVLTFFEMLRVLLRRRPGTLLVQTPPAFPTLLAGAIAARILGARLIVDWHNYGYTMLALRTGANHQLVHLMEGYERWMGRGANAHFCVSAAMAADLEKRFGVRAQVLYDRPVKLLPGGGGSGPLVVVCPAGWTADEDMAMLLDALELLRERSLEVHLTGDGPLRAGLEARIGQLRASGLPVSCGFLGERDYWELIGRSDLGVSMHRSSSGLDLAMKVVDLCSAGTPVCAFDYGPTVREQIREGETGFLFRDARELAGILDRAQRSAELVRSMRARVREQWSVTWGEEWDRVAGPAVL